MITTSHGSGRWRMWSAQISFTSVCQHTCVLSAYICMFSPNQKTNVCRHTHAHARTHACMYDGTVRHTHSTYTHTHARVHTHTLLSLAGHTWPPLLHHFPSPDISLKSLSGKTTVGAMRGCLHQHRLHARTVLALHTVCTEHCLPFLRTPHTAAC